MTKLEAHGGMVIGYGRGRPACPCHGQPWPRQAPSRLEAAAAQQQMERHAGTGNGDGSGATAAWASTEMKEEG